MPAAIRSCGRHETDRAEIAPKSDRRHRVAPDRPPGTVDLEPFEPLAAEEARRLIYTTRDHPLHSVVHLAVHTGLRRGELLGLTWEDIDLNAGPAVNRRSLERISDNGLVLFPTKTKASERRIALPAACVQNLRGHRTRQQAEHEDAGLRRNPRGYVFTAPSTALPVEPDTLNRRFATLLHQAGLRRIRLVSRPGARYRECSRSVSPDRSPNPPCRWVGRQRGACDQALFRRPPTEPDVRR
ncbi:tyrosine-type recombinase/integrase [Kitasatospora purpeofusca]|uniref:tyrosine-type recombinase/integrase n=1 Tax=Kitasatospora purpeofusca TaxID=67352 RepID=UPI003990A160